MHRRSNLVLCNKAKNGITDDFMSILRVKPYSGAVDISAQAVEINVVSYFSVRYDSSGYFDTYSPKLIIFYSVNYKNNYK